jgi:hypothetical protein
VIRAGNELMPPRHPEDKAKVELPLVSALTGPALVGAVLYVAGFSYEWAFYYNFGLEHLARQLPTLSTAMAAFEVVRDTADALYTVALLAVPQILLAIVSSFGRTFSRSSLRPVQLLASAIAAALDAGNGLIRVVLSAFLLVYAAAFAGSSAGTHAYRTLAIEADNRLPRVTITGDIDTHIRCEQHSGLAMPSTDTTISDAFIGSAGPLAELRGGRACNLPGQSSWRLLYRDEKFVYLFQTLRSTNAGRPMTLVLPASEKQILILNGGEGNGQF